MWKNLKYFGQKQQIFVKSLSNILLLFLVFLLQSSLVFSQNKVTLNENELNEIMSLINKSETDLTEAQNELVVSQKLLKKAETETKELQKELVEVKITYAEQKTSYEMQLKEAKKNNVGAWIVGGASTTTSIVLAIVLLVVLL